MFVMFFSRHGVYCWYMLLLAANVGDILLLLSAWLNYARPVNWEELFSLAQLLTVDSSV